MTSENNKVERLSPSKINAIVTDLRRTFGLNAHQVATLVGTTTVSLYGHMSGNEAIESGEKYAFYGSLAEAVRSRVDGSVRQGLKSVMVDGKTLLGHLKDPEITEDRIVFVSSVVADQIRNRVATPISPVDLKRTIRDCTISS